LEAILLALQQLLEQVYYMNVAILGASNKEMRYANKAQKLLMEKGYSVFPISRKGQDILGTTSVRSLNELEVPIDTVTVYVNPISLKGLVGDIESLKPRRVILNPGTEDKESEQRLSDTGILVEKACTLVLLNTGQFG